MFNLSVHIIIILHEFSVLFLSVKLSL